MENVNTQPQPKGLAGNITEKAPDPFADQNKISDETQKLMDKMEEKETGIIKPVAAPVVKEVPKKETFLERLLSNAGLGTAAVKPSTPSGKTVTTPVKLKPKVDFTKFTRGFLIVLILLAVCFGGYLFIFLTNIDAQLVKITLNGKVTDTVDAKALEGVEIFIDNTSVGKTDSNGNYSIKLDKLAFVFKVSLKDFNDFEENVTIPRTILSYSFNKNVSLTSSKVAQVTGKFIANNPNYNFSNDKLFFNDEEFILKADGTFSLTKVPTGNVKLTFESASFKDISQQITLNPGINTINDIKLTAAGDAVGSVISYIREDMVTKTGFSIENVQDNQITINDEGKFRIKDLDVGREYKIRSMADGYLTRDYAITIKQGENEVFGFKMVENGLATYIGTDEKNLQHFYSTDLDGENVKELEAVKDFKPANEYFESRDGLLYFLSQHDRVKNSFKTIDVAYSLNPIDLTLTRLTNANLDAIDSLTPNFRAKKLISNYQNRNDAQKRRVLQFMDLSGDNLKTVRTVTGNVNYDNIKISGNGRFVYFREGELQNDKADTPIIYRADSQSDQIVKVAQRKKSVVEAVSEDGNWVVYSSLNETTTFRDLFLFNSSTNETRTIKENHDGTQYQFLNQNPDQLIFNAKRDGKMDIYSYSISQNSTSRISNLAIDDEIQNLYQQEKYAFYITKKGLYVIDVLKPKSFKLITNKVTKFTN
ncbi:MAG: hypothetical protein ABIM99_05200 [Candidatus Dojkabacteria bacterium]